MTSHRSTLRPCSNHCEALPHIALPTRQGLGWTDRTFFFDLNTHFCGKIAHRLAALALDTR
jgi:hypothetical protein